jgi:hypothetical protein
LNRAAVQFDQVLADGKAKAGPLMSAREMVRGLFERFHYVTQFAGWDADPRIGHANDGKFVMVGAGNFDLSARFGELNRVGKEIEHHLHNGAAVPGDVKVVFLRHVGKYLDLCIERAALDHMDGKAHHLEKIELFDVEFVLSGFNFGHIQNVADEVE